jgi:hypothetical protein
MLSLFFVEHIEESPKSIYKDTFLKSAIGSVGDFGKRNCLIAS